LENKESVFSNQFSLPYLCSMEVFNIILPTSWDELTDEQLHMVYSLFARDLSAAEVKTLCLMKWNGLQVLSLLPDKRFLIKRGKVFDKPNEQRKACFISGINCLFDYYSGILFNYYLHVLPFLYRYTFIISSCTIMASYLSLLPSPSHLRRYKPLLRLRPCNDSRIRDRINSLYPTLRT